MIKDKVISEVQEALEWNDIALDAIIWIGSRDGGYAMTWNEFLVADIPDGTEWGFPFDLVVVGGDWWLETDEEQPSYLVFKTSPLRAPEAVKFASWW